MATRKQIFDLVLIELGMDTQDRRYAPRVVYAVVDSVRSQLIPQYVATYGESALELLCIAVILDVKKSIIRSRQYVELPFQILGGSDRAGIIQVSLPQEEESSFIAVQLGMLSVYSRLEAGGAAGRQLYWLEGTNIFFKQLPAGVDKILVKAIPTTYDLIDEDMQVPMPAEFLAMVITATKERLAPKQPGIPPVQDKQNDTRDAA